MSGTTGANLPVRIQIEGTQQAEAQFNRVGQAGAAAMQRVQQASQGSTAATRQFGLVTQQAGFQVQDFATQVASGQSALVAFGQQAPQFLGVFGVGGAIAGAAVSIGVLAAQLLSVGGNAETAGRAAEQGFQGIARAAEDLKKIIAEVNDLFLTQEQRARNARIAVVAELGARLAAQEDVALQFQEESAASIPGAQRDLAAAQRRLAQAEREADRVRRSGGMVPQDELSTAGAAVFSAQARLDGLTADLERQSRVLGEIRAQRARLGNAPDEAPTTARGGSGSTPRAGLDVAGSVAATLADLTARVDEFNQGLNLQEAGLSGATAALAAYAREQELLAAAVDAGVISEDEFGEAVARSSERLAEQIEQLERRGERTSDAGRQLGLTFSSAFEDAISRGRSFSDVLKGIEQDIARIIIRQGVTNPLTDAVKNASGPLTTAVGEFIRSIPGFGGARAMGGPVSAGRTYLVGERGPELFTPNSDGGITPNNALGGTVFAPVYNIDARGADPSMMPRLRAEMAAISQAAVAQFADSIQRGGSAARLVGRRA